MTEWNVYTIGGIEFIYSVFNAVAMLMNSGTFSEMFRIAALLGVIGVVISSAISGGKTISFQNMAVCFVMYMLFFQVSARVNIEDVTNGTFKAVDNIPAGLAASASIISTVGYAVTEKMEQAFSTPQMTSYGALDPLIAMSTLYDTMKDPMRWSMASTSTTANLPRSVLNYMQSCVTNDILRGTTTFANLYRSSSGVSGLASSDGFQRVLIFDGKGAGWQNQAAKSANNESIYPCNTAFSRVQTQMQGSSTTLTNAFNKSYTALGRTCSGVACAGTSKIQEVMDFYNIQSTDLRDFQLTMVMYPYLRDVPNYGYENSFRGTAAVTRSQTMTQQAFQWASSGSSFLSWMSSFMPIFQGLIYALAPFMAFLIGLGVMGLRLILKYLLVIVWTQTWMPLAAIVNLYVLVSVQESMASILSGTTALTFNQLYSILTETQKSIGLAGNLYSMIPALGGFIVWGSSIAFNSLANSAAAPHAGDTKPLTPDIANAPAINSRMSDSNYSIAQGTTAVGTSQRVPQINMASAASRSLSSSSQELQSSSIQLQAAQQSLLSDAVTNTSSGGTSNSWGESFQNSFSRLNSADQAYVDKYGEQNGMNRQQSILHMATASAAAAGGVGAPGGSPIKAGVTGNLGQSNAESRQQNAGDSTSIGKDTSSGLKDTTSDNNSRIVNQLTNTLSSELSAHNVQASSVSNYSNAYQQNKSAQESYQRAEAFTQSASINQSMSADYIGNALTGNQEAQRTMTQILAAHPEAANEISENASRLTSTGMTSTNAHAVAQFLALNEVGKASEVAGALGYVTNVSGDAPNITPDAASANQGVSGDASNSLRNIGAIRGGVEGGSGGVRSESAGRLSTAQGITEPYEASNRVGEEAMQGQGQVKNVHEQNSAQHHQVTGNAAAANLEMSKYDMGGVTGSLQSGADYVVNMFTKTPNYESQYDRAKYSADSVSGIGEDKQDAKEAIVRYAAATKAGGDANSDQGVEALRSDLIARVQLATGGQAQSDGSVVGGNLALAQGMVSRLDSDARNPQLEGDTTVKLAVTSLNTNRDGMTQDSYAPGGQAGEGVRHNPTYGANGSDNITQADPKNRGGQEDTMVVNSK